MKFKKWICKNFGCKIIKIISPGFFNVECARCGEVFRITSKEHNWHRKAIKAILVDCSLFSTKFNIEDYRKAALIQGDSQ